MGGGRRRKNMRPQPQPPVSPPALPPAQFPGRFRNASTEDGGDYLFAYASSSSPSRTVPASPCSSPGRPLPGGIDTGLCLGSELDSGGGSDAWSGSPRPGPGPGAGAGPGAGQQVPYSSGHVYSHLYGESGGGSPAAAQQGQGQGGAAWATRSPPSSSSGKGDRSGSGRRKGDRDRDRDRDRGKKPKDCRVTLLERDRSYLSQRREQKRRLEREDKYQHAASEGRRGRGRADSEREAESTLWGLLDLSAPTPERQREPGAEAEAGAETDRDITEAEAEAQSSPRGQATPGGASPAADELLSEEGFSGWAGAGAGQGLKTPTPPETPPPPFYLPPSPAPSEWAPTPVPMGSLRPLAGPGPGPPGGGSTVVGSRGLLGDLSLATSARERVLAEVLQALYHRAPPQPRPAAEEGGGGEDEDEGRFAMRVEHAEDSDEEEEEGEGGEGMDDYFFSVAAARDGRAAHEAFVGRRLLAIRRALHPCVTMDYLRRTLSAAFQFVLSQHDMPLPGGGAAGAGGAGGGEGAGSAGPGAAFSIVIPLYPKPLPASSWGTGTAQAGGGGQGSDAAPPAAHSAFSKRGGDPAPPAGPGQLPRRAQLAFTPTAPRRAARHVEEALSTPIGRSKSVPVLALGDAACAHPGEWGGEDGGGLPPIAQSRSQNGVSDAADAAASTAAAAAGGPLARFVSPPLVSRQILSLYAADERVTSYSCQFLKAMYMARAALPLRLGLALQLRECTRVRGLRARVFEYARTHLGADPLSEGRGGGGGAGGNPRDHLGSILDLLELCVRLPLHLYAQAAAPTPTPAPAPAPAAAALTGPAPATLLALVETFCLIVCDCLGSVGSGLGMNAGAADGIYAQQHLVGRIGHCVALLMNTACMHDDRTRNQAGTDTHTADTHTRTADTHARSVSVPVPLRRSVVQLLLQRLLCHWPRARRLAPGQRAAACTIHSLLLQGGAVQQRGGGGQPLDLEGGYAGGRMGGGVPPPPGPPGDGGGGASCAGQQDQSSYLAVRVNSPNAVREEAYLATCFELLCSHACVEAYGWHPYQRRAVKAEAETAAPSAAAGDDAIPRLSGALRPCGGVDASVDRLLARLLAGIQSDHFKLALRCLACFQDRGLCVLRRFFLDPCPPQDEGEGEVGYEQQAAAAATAAAGGGCSRAMPDCCVCALLAGRREERLERLVGALRAARGQHWNSTVREAAGELLDQLMDLM
jgi:hypothetical protein